MDSPERRRAIGVCYVTAVAGVAGDVDDLVVRIVMTADVAGGDATTRVATGPDDAGELLRSWMAAMCDRPQLMMVPAESGG